MSDYRNARRQALAAWQAGHEVDYLRGQAFAEAIDELGGVARIQRGQRCIREEFLRVVGGPSVTSSTLL